MEELCARGGRGLVVLRSDWSFNLYHSPHIQVPPASAHKVCTLGSAERVRGRLLNSTEEKEEKKAVGSGLNGKRPKEISYSSNYKEH